MPPVGEFPVDDRVARLLGVDAARAVALAGMFATHLLPLTGDDGNGTFTGLLADGRASALFAVLAGVGIGLSTGGVRPPVDARAHLAATAGLVVRGGLVGLVGLALVGLDPHVAVILAYYGLLFFLATPLLRLRAPALAVLAALSCGLAPVLSHVLRTGHPMGPGEQAGLGALGHPVDLLSTLTLTGYYPALPWTAYLLTGMALGRLDLGRIRTAVVLVVGGVALAVAAAAGSVLLLGPGGGAAAIGPDIGRRSYGTTLTSTWWWLAVDAPHSGTPFDLAGTIGTALAVLGAMLLLARRPPLVWLPAAVGSVPLTLYTLHVIAVAVDPGDGSPDLWLSHLLVAALIGVALSLAGHRGPLEAPVSWASRSARRVIVAPARTPP